MLETSWHKVARSHKHRHKVNGHTNLETKGPIFEKSYNEVTQNLWQTYDDITAILRKRKIRGKWCHSGNPLTEAVIGRIHWAENNWQPDWLFPKNAYEKWHHFPKKISGSRISLTYKNFWKSYDELTKNLTKSYEVLKIAPKAINRNLFPGWRVLSPSFSSHPFAPLFFPFPSLSRQIQLMGLWSNVSPHSEKNDVCNHQTRTKYTKECVAAENVSDCCKSHPRNLETTANVRDVSYCVVATTSYVLSLRCFNAQNTALVTAKLWTNRLRDKCKDIRLNRDDIRHTHTDIHTQDDVVLFS